MKEFFKRIGKSEIQNILGIINTTGAFALVFLIALKAVPMENREIVSLGLGYLFGSNSNSNGFFFSASKKADTTVVKKTEQDADNS